MKTEMTDLAASAAAQVAENALAALRSLISEQTIRGIIEREAKVVVHSVLLTQAEHTNRSVTPLPVQAPSDPKDLPLALRIKAVADLLGLSRAKVYRLIACGDLKARKLGAATIVLRADLEAFLSTLPRKEMRA